VSGERWRRYSSRHYRARAPGWARTFKPGLQALEPALKVTNTLLKRVFALLAGPVSEMRAENGLVDTESGDQLKT